MASVNGKGWVSSFTGIHEMIIDIFARASRKGYDICASNPLETLSKICHCSLKIVGNAFVRKFIEYLCVNGSILLNKWIPE